MTWFKRISDGIRTKTADKKETPDGVWYKCMSCNKTMRTKTLLENLKVCTNCNYHHRITSQEYFDIILDGENRQEHFNNLVSKDFLGFTDLKSYATRLEDTKEKSGLTDALRVMSGTVVNQPLVICAMDFGFIGGSMGSVVGEKISRAIDLCIAQNTPLLIVTKSGGARMMESAFSLMQMAKTAGKLGLLAKKKIPYFVLLTDPTTGGVTASFAMLGDIHFAEPGALIGFAGPRVIKETIKKELPSGFQRSEFLQEKGFVDCIIHRKDLREKMAQFISFFEN